MSAPGVLLVEDDDHVALACRLLLGLHGYDVFLVRSSVEAVDALATRHFDAVVTDLDLGDGTGLEVAEASLDAAVPRCVVASGDLAALGAIVETATLHVLPKPFSAERLLGELDGAR